MNNYNELNVKWKITNAIKSLFNTLTNNFYNLLIAPLMDYKISLKELNQQLINFKHWLRFFSHNLLIKTFNLSIICFLIDKNLEKAVAFHLCEVCN